MSCVTIFWKQNKKYPGTSRSLGIAMIKDWVLKICMIDFVGVKRITCMHKCVQGLACFCKWRLGTAHLSTKQKIQKAMVFLHLIISIEIVLSSETSWLRLNYSWLNPTQIFYHSVVCTKPWKFRSCQFPSSSASSVTDNAVVSMSWGIYQKCCKMYLWNNLPTREIFTLPVPLSMCVYVFSNLCHHNFVCSHYPYTCQTLSFTMIPCATSQENCVLDEKAEE